MAVDDRPRAFQIVAVEQIERGDRLCLEYPCRVHVEHPDWSGSATSSSNLGTMNSPATPDPRGPRGELPLPLGFRILHLFGRYGLDDVRGQFLLPARRSAVRSSAIKSREMSV